MNRVKLLCSNCNANLEINDDKKILFCPYCGSKELIIEDKDVKIAEINKEIELSKINVKKEKNLQKQKIEEEKNKTEQLKVKLFFIAVIIIASILFLRSHNPIRYIKNYILPHNENEIQVTVDEWRCDGDKLKACEENFRSMGFEKIELIEQTNTLAVMVRGTNESVNSVAINGDSDFKKGDWFPKDATVVITYYN